MQVDRLWKKNLALNVWKFWVAFFLAASRVSALPLLAFHEDAAVQTERSFFLNEVAAFSNATANGVRREGVDTALRKYAFMALSHVRTGMIYNVSLPPSLGGIFCQAMRVRVGSARKRGLLFNEFRIPRGMVVRTGGPFVIMVYRRIENFTLYSAPDGYAMASPVVGIIIYTNLNTTLDNSPLPEMSVLSRNTSITIELPLLSQVVSILPHHASTPLLCAFFDINGTVSFTNVSSTPNICSSKVLTDVALVVPKALRVASIPSPAPTQVRAPSPPPPSSSSSSSPSSSSSSSSLSSEHESNTWKIVVLAVIGGVVGLAWLTIIIVMGLKRRNERQAAQVDEPPDDEETLQTSLIGDTRAPTAAGIRTRPVLETGSLHT